MAPFERGRALVIGVGAYGDPRWDVPTARRDAEGLYETLTDPDLGGYGRGQAELLRDEDATKRGVLEALRRLANRCSPDSVALISFTGHGALGDDELYYLATHDARFTPAERIARNTGLQAAELARALRDIPARQLLLVVNACSSGHLAARLRGAAVAPDEADPVASQMPPNEATDELLASGEGRAVITASRADQLSYFMPDERHSYFGQALIDALSGGAASAARGYVGLYELYERVFEQVRDVTARRLGVPQEPVLTLVQHVGPFPLARYPRAASDDPTIRQRPPEQLPVRVVARDTIAAIGRGATAVRAEAGSTVTVDNSQHTDNRVISLDGATVMGGLSIGNVAGQDLTIYNPDPAGGDKRAPDPRRDLPLLRERVAAALNVDVDARDEAAAKLDLAYKALERGDGARARQRVDEALALLAPMSNGNVKALVRKITAVRAVM